MVTIEPQPMSDAQLKKIFKEAAEAYKKRDFHQARELLEIIIAQDPLYSQEDRRACDLLTDVEFQLSERSSTRKKNRLLMVASVSLAAITLILGILLAIASQKNHQLSAASATVNATLSAQSSFLRSAAITVTAASLRAESAQATMTTMRQNPGSAQATIQAYEALSAVGELSNQPIVGPFTGQLSHAETGFVISEGANVYLKNFIAQARFMNPYGSNEQGFDYGFFFRDTGGDQQYRLVVNSEATWILDLVSDPEWNTLESGSLTNFDTSTGGINDLKLVVIDDRALFYVNNEFIQALPVGAKMEPGDVFIVTASFEDHEKFGSATGYQDFTIWALP